MQALLAYLVLRRDRATPRGTLAGVFWGDLPEARAKACLNTTLWRLRRLLEPDNVPRGHYLICTPAHEVAFNGASDFWLDVADLEEAARLPKGRLGRLDAQRLQRLERALQSYDADLLAGSFDDWALAERNRLRMLRLDAFDALMSHWRQAGASLRAIGCGERILEQDALREAVHRDLMRLYLDTGQRVQAIRQYQSCRAVLARELGIRPSSETVALYESIKSGGAEGAVPRSDVVAAAVQELEELIRALDEARERLSHVVPVVRSVDGHGDGVAPDRRQETG